MRILKQLFEIVRFCQLLQPVDRHRVAGLVLVHDLLGRRGVHRMGNGLGGTEILVTFVADQGAVFDFASRAAIFLLRVVADLAQVNHDDQRIAKARQSF